MAPAADLVTKSPFKLGSDLATLMRTQHVRPRVHPAVPSRIHLAPGPPKSGHAAAQNFQFGLPQTDGQGTKIGAPIGGYLKPSLSMPRLTRTSAALTCC